ncbi:MAG: precorrin-8X methylmutase [Chromatiales bacterium]|jgi:precorrin-8X/cobalt-precorrin-8 methylmutase|nr:precorrin-8X methylmutase [Chromatiales bacterium]
MTLVFDYIRSPEAIYGRSFDLVQAATDLSRLPPQLHSVALRVVHACAMPDVVDDLAWQGDVAHSAHAALVDGAPILADCEMVAHGITRSRLPANNEVVCTLNDERVPVLAKRIGNTRSAAAVDLWVDQLAGAVVAIGNAPTALFHLLELLSEGAPAPAAILAFPVGFVGAAESKEALRAMPLDLPFLTLTGRRGGSAMAAAAVNAVAKSTQT